MKTFGMLALAAVLTAGAAAAQTTQDLGNTRTAGATYASGIVDASSSTSLSIKNEAGGRLTFLLDEHTVNPAKPAVGSRVRINYHTNENGVAIADEIQGVGGADTKVAASSMATSESSASTYAPAAAPAAPPVSTETEPAPPAASEPAPMSSTTSTSATTEPAPSATTEPSALPKTASELPLLGAIGLAALAGAAALRSAR